MPQPFWVFGLQYRSQYKPVRHFREQFFLHVFRIIFFFLWNIFLLPVCPKMFSEGWFLKLGKTSADGRAVLPMQAMFPCLSFMLQWGISTYLYKADRDTSLSSDVPLADLCTQCDHQQTVPIRSLFSRRTRHSVQFSPYQTRKQSTVVRPDQSGMEPDDFLCGKHQPANVRLRTPVFLVMVWLQWASPSEPFPWNASYLFGALSPGNHKGLHQGWTQTSFCLTVIHFTSHNAISHVFVVVVVVLSYSYSAGTQHGNLHPAGWPILFCGPTEEPVFTTANIGKTQERVWKKCKWMDRKGRN